MLSWNLPSNSNCGVVKYYEIEYDQRYSSTNTYINNPGTVALIYNAQQTSYTVTQFANGMPLVAGTVYRFQIKACNQNGCNVSNTVTASLSASNGVKLTNLQVQDAGINMLKLWWTVSSGSDSAPTGQIQYVYKVTNANGQTNEVQCLNWYQRPSECYLMLDYLRLGPYNIKTGETFSLLVVTGADSDSSCGASTDGKASVTFVMPVQCTNPATCPFKTFALQTSVDTQKNVASSQQSSTSYQGLEKNSEVNGKKSALD